MDRFLNRARIGKIKSLTKIDGSKKLDNSEVEISAEIS